MILALAGRRALGGRTILYYRIRGKLATTVELDHVQGVVARVIRRAQCGMVRQINLGVPDHQLFVVERFFDEADSEVCRDPIHFEIDAYQVQGFGVYPDRTVIPGQAFRAVVADAEITLLDGYAQVEADSLATV